MTTIAFLAAVSPFAIAMSFTPGPNNLMLANSGARFGFVRTLPHQVGVLIGFALMMLCVGLGVSALIVAEPALYRAMKIASIVYIFWLAWKIVTVEARGAGPGAVKPMGFLQGAAFQWVNPKAWVMTLTAVATYTTLHDDLRLQVALLAMVFAVVGAASGSTWVMFGQMIRRYLISPRRRSAYNWTMAALLVASILPVMFEH
ncbi:LysE family translocator [Sphingomonas nostoxanthinifaciens]|uniref:LysE family translocator n=1 Tax=Sphingomonas nostoxanthinifaciens TaxID=2872652 RepID=UPI001CC2075E|nr:LysE family translocator [Sphingomonas nostoxanthinifaciens]UAK26246.1 LysE family translocator [Sphingomonas nostoxanthinifaciens]